MGKRARIGFFGLAGLAMAAAPGIAVPLRLGPAFTGSFPQVDLVLEAPATQGLPAAADLTVLEDGRPTGPAQAVLPFSQSGHPMAVVVAVDASGTMAGEPLEELKEALRSLIASRGPHDDVALVSFADDVKVDAPFGAPEQDLRRAVDRLAARGRITELYKGLFKALALLDEKKDSRKRLLVVSDGHDEGAAYELDDVVQRAQSLRIPVDAVGLTRIDTRYLSSLERLADLTGGAYARAETSQDLERLVGSGIERLRSTPVVRFAAHEISRDGAPHRLGLRWTRAGEVLEAEVPVAIAPAATPQAERPKEGQAWRDRLASPAVFGIAALVLALLVVLVVARARRRTAAPGVSPGVAAHAPPPPPPRVAAVPPPPLPLPKPAPPVPGHTTIASSPAAPSPAASPPVPPLRKVTRFRHELRAPAAGAPSAILVGESGSLAGVRFPIDRDPFWIGAREGNDLTIQEDAYLSSRHAWLRYHEGTLLLQDRGSTNGTFVNGERLGETPSPVAPGDHIRVGRTSFVVLAP